MPTSFHRPLIGLLLLTAPATAQVTWTVGGPNGQFATIQEALDVAGPEDLVDVQNGTYPAFTMSSPTRLMGRAGVQVLGQSTLLGLPAGSTALVADLRIHPSLDVIDCEGSTLVEGLTTSHLEIHGSGDVRLRGLSAQQPTSLHPATVVIEASRVQFEGSTIEGWSDPTIDGGRGRHAMQASAGSFVHLMDSTLVGGDGAWTSSFFTWQAPSGGDGLLLSGASAARIVRSELVGGGGGFHALATPGANHSDGRHGSGLRQCGGHSERWESEIRNGYWVGSFTSPSPDVDLDCGATLGDSIDLPGLTLSGPLTTGSNFDLTASAGAGTSLRLVFGRATDLDVTLGTPIPRLVAPGRIASLGAVPQSGEVHVTGTVPAWPRGTLFYLQVSRTGATGTDFSNSTLFLVR